MGGRVVEGTGLENRQACKRLEGSNPSPSASIELINLLIWKDRYRGNWRSQRGTAPNGTRLAPNAFRLCSQAGGLLG